MFRPSSSPPVGRQPTDLCDQDRNCCNKHLDPLVEKLSRGVNGGNSTRETRLPQPSKNTGSSFQAVLRFPRGRPYRKLRHRIGRAAPNSPSFCSLRSQFGRQWQFDLDSRKALEGAVFQYCCAYSQKYCSRCCLPNNHVARHPSYERDGCDFHARFLQRLQHYNLRHGRRRGGC